MNDSRILDSYEAYGCSVNRISIDELFRRYEQVGFLYPAKMQRLAPFLPVVKDNWRKGRRGGELIHWVATYDDPAVGAWGAICSWRSTDTGWITQHLVSAGNPVASRAVMLGGQAVRIRDGLDSSHQSWFRRTNRYANKIFGSTAAVLGEDNAWVGDYTYFFLPLRISSNVSTDLHVAPANRLDLPELREFVVGCRSTPYAIAEGLMEDDIELEAVDQLYRRVGLRRFRKVFVARRAQADEIIGAALAYRGPIGFNFSFLENRCDLILSDRLSPSGAVDACSALAAAATPVYEDLELGVVPLIADPSCANAVRSLGGTWIRDYAQSICLRAGYERWYRHVAHFFDRIVKADRARGLGSREAIASESA